MTKHERYSAEAGSDEPRKWYGVYLGVIANRRTQDLWCKVQVPQVMGDTVSDWARPMGFSSIADILPYPAAAFNKIPVTGATGGFEYANLEPLGWGGYVSHKQAPNGRPIGIAEPGEESGPGPPVGTPVLVLFIGGDRNYPVYALTSERIN